MNAPMAGDDHSCDRVFAPQPMTDTGDYGYPPSTRRQDYALVLLQLLWRMRFDLMVLLLVSILIHHNWIPRSWTADDSVVRIMGIAASVFLGFRNTQAISRLWEARKLWGDVVNVSRNWTDSLRAHLDSSRPPGRQERKLLRLQLAIVWQLNFELRNFWNRDLRDLQDNLLSDLRLATTTNLRQLGQLRGGLDRRASPGRTDRRIRTHTADGCRQQLQQCDRRAGTHPQHTASCVLRSVCETSELAVRPLAAAVLPRPESRLSESFGRCGDRTAFSDGRTHQRLRGGPIRCRQQQLFASPRQHLPGDQPRPARSRDGSRATSQIK